MNKENQKKYNQYKKDKARADKLYATKDKALLEHAAVSSALAAAIEKLTNKWQPKLTKADKKADVVSVAPAAAPVSSFCRQFPKDSYCKAN